MNHTQKWFKTLTAGVFGLLLVGCANMPGEFQPSQRVQNSAAYNTTYNGFGVGAYPNNISGLSNSADGYGYGYGYGANGYTPPYTMPNYAGSQFAMIPPTPGVMTGTEVSQKIESMRGDLTSLQSNVQSNSDQFRALREQTEALSQSYHGTIAAISARLQVGTTPGNPILVQQWNEAQAQLDRLNESVGRLNSVAGMVASNSTVANYLLEAARAAYSISGAVDEDHRQLRIMEDDINRTVVMIERLLKELSEDVSRQTAYVSAERSNLTALSLAVKNGELYGMSLANRGFPTTPPTSAASRPFDSAVQPVVSEALPDSASAPLIVIRFDKSNVSYERDLYAALSKALERKPSAQFNLVAVSPGRGNPAAQSLSSSNARKSAEQVLRSLSDMGLPSNRVVMSAKTSSTIENNEVELYVR